MGDDIANDDVRAIEHRLLVKGQADKADALGRRPLGFAAAYGTERIVKMLLDAGAPVDSRDARERTALHIACMYGRAEIAETLIDHGAKLDARGVLGLTPMHVAARLGQNEIVELIRRSPGAALLDTREFADKQGWLPLHHAAAFGRRSCLDLVIPYRDIWRATAQGKSALHLAAHLGQFDALDEIVHWAGASSTPDRLARTPGELTEAAARAAKLVLPDCAFITPTRECPDFEHDEEAPVVVVHYRSGYPGAVPMVSGDLLAVWSNGVLTFSPDLQWGQRPRRVGRVDPKRVSELMADLDDIGFFASGSMQFAGEIDGGQMDLVVRSNGRTVQWSTSYESPLVPRTSSQPATYSGWDPIFEGTWQLAGKLLRQIIPEESWPL